MSYFTIADDDDNYLFLLHHQLVTAFPGKSIALFSSAEDAMSHVLNSGTKLVITDHTMGGLSGTDLIRDLRARDRGLPIIMVSGDRDAEEEALAAGATLFLHKDVALKRLVKEVKHLCGKGIKVRSEHSHLPPALPANRVGQTFFRL